MINLTRRQVQILQAVVDGLNYKQIGYRYGIHEKTVGIHIQNIKRRMGTYSVARLVTYAIVLDLVKTPTKNQIIERLENENRN